MKNSHKHGKYAASREKSSGLSTLKKFTAVVVSGVVMTTYMMTAASDSKIAVITDGDLTYTVTTVETDTSGILEEAGLSLSYYDEAIVTEESSERIDINIIRAFPVKISADGGARFINVTGGTVADALKLANVKVSASDFVTPAQNTKLTSDTVIEVVRGVKIYVTCDGETRLAYVPQGSVGEALDYLGCELCENGNEGIDVDSPVEKGMELNTQKVTYRTAYKQEKIKPGIIEEACADLEKGKREVKQEGKEGVLEIAVSEKYINGVLVESEEQSKQVLRKPVNEVILVGIKSESSETDTDSDSFNTESLSEKNSDTDSATDSDKIEENKEQAVFANFVAYVKPEQESYTKAEEDSDTYTDTENNNADYNFGSAFDISGNGLSYSRLITGNCTAYYEPNGITATGTIPQVGTVAVNPNVIPYGTRLYVCSADGSYVYGYAIAEDTGGACMAGDIVLDLYMNSEEDCNEFGRRELNIYVLD